MIVRCAAVAARVKCAARVKPGGMSQKGAGGRPPAPRRSAGLLLGAKPGDLAIDGGEDAGAVLVVERFDAGEPLARLLQPLELRPGLRLAARAHDHPGAVVFLPFVDVDEPLTVRAGLGQLDFAVLAAADEELAPVSAVGAVGVALVI